MPTTTTTQPTIAREVDTPEPCFNVTVGDRRVRWLSFADATTIARRVALGETLDDVELDVLGGGDEWFPTCSICDGAGHGYPGAGPCPLEDRGYDTDGIWR
jgi:hypothetical protein